ncbi:MAG: hypothetical protein ACOYNC_00810 [Bacteroidales bacterium]
MKTASRIFMTFVLLAFFSGMTYSQVASTAVPAKSSAKQATTTPAKSACCAQQQAAPAGDHGKNFVDKNGDGKCDNCGTTGKCKESGNCGAKGAGCASGCSKGMGKGNCGGNGGPNKSCGSNQGTKATEGQPNK